MLGSALLLSALGGMGALLPPTMPLKQDLRAFWTGGVSQTRGWLDQTLAEWRLPEAVFADQTASQEPEASARARQALTSLGFPAGEGKGWQSPAMGEALAKFQATRNLAPTGEPNATTREALEWAWTVQQAQRALNRQGIDAGPEDGIMGDKTRRALEQFQRAHDLPVTGELDARTRQALLPDFDPDIAG